jgi:hypothetical protein
MNDRSGHRGASSKPAHSNSAHLDLDLDHLRCDMKQIHYEAMWNQKVGLAVAEYPSYTCGELKRRLRVEIQVPVHAI